MAGIFLKVLNMSISASWIVLVVLVLRLLLKKAPKWINCVLWGIVGLRLIMPFSFESVLSLIPSAETISKAPDSPRPHFESGITIVDNQVNSYIQGTYFEGVSKPMGNFIDITTILGLIWIIGILILLIYTVFSYVRLKNKVSTAVMFHKNIYLCETVVSPFVLGIIKPRIYLPFHMSEHDMEHVIAHEQAHIQRKDHWWKPLGFLILTLHWFNPLLWFGYVVLCRDIELACDEKVVKRLNTEQRADYSQALLTCSVNRRMIAACPLAFGEVGIKDRVKSVLNYKKPAFWIILVAIVASIVVAVCFLTNPVNSNDNSEKNATLIGVVEEVYDNYIMVRAEQIDGYPKGEIFKVSLKTEDNRKTEFDVGDSVIVYYNGEVAESDPLQINGVYSISFRTTPDTEEYDMTLPEYEGDIVLKESPVLFVATSERIIEALKGTRSWSYIDEKGETFGVEGDAMHPLLLKDFMPVLDLVPTYLSHVDPLSATLQFNVESNSFPPDEVYVRCWSEQDWGKVDAKAKEDIEITTDKGNICIKLEEGNYIYEVIATWNSSDKYSGTVSYTFCTVKPDMNQQEESSNNQVTSDYDEWGLKMDVLFKSATEFNVVFEHNSEKMTDKGTLTTSPEFEIRVIYEGKTISFGDYMRNVLGKDYEDVDFTWDTVLYMIASDNTTTINEYLLGTYGQLPDGQYVLCKKVTLTTDSGEKTTKVYTTEFAIVD